MSNNVRHLRQLLRPTAQRTDLVSNELLDLVVPRHSNHLKSGLLSRLNGDIGQGLLAPEHASRAHSEVGPGGQPPTKSATETTSSDVTGCPCVRCWKTCKKYSDMVRHFEQLHIIPTEFQCPECGKRQKRRAHVVSHYATRHGSSRGDTCIPLEVTCPFAPVAFGCGFCDQGNWRYSLILSCRKDILQALSHVKVHILEGKTRTDWNVTHQIEGLLLHEHILPEWFEVCGQTFDSPVKNWPRLRWTPEVAAAFVSELEQPIAETRLRPLLQELLLAGLGPALSSTSGDRIVSDYSQEQLNISEHGNEPTQGPLAPLLYSDYGRDDLTITATSDFDNLFQPIEPFDNSFLQPHNAEEQELLLEATGSQFFPTP